MIISSSKDYIENLILLLWQDTQPSKEEIAAHCRKEYGDSVFILEITQPSDFKGMVNNGTVIAAVRSRLS